VSVALAGGGAPKPLLASTLPAGDSKLPWAGLAADGKRVPDGRYRATVTVGAAPLTLSYSVPLTVDTRAPRVTLLSVVPLRIRVNERASLLGTIDGRRVSRSLKAGFTTLPLRAFRRLRLVARDVAGNDSRVVNWPRR
jgi:hypothetical protein